MHNLITLYTFLIFLVICASPDILSKGSGGAEDGTLPNIPSPPPNTFQNLAPVVSS
ncbi:MAG: hypothetical protein AAFY59_07225 [Pseudomonadota bacterium]